MVSPDDLIEMAEDDLSLTEFVAAYSLPHVAKVTQGYCSDSDSDEHDFSTNDVIKVSHAFLKFSATASSCGNLCLYFRSSRSTATSFSASD